LNAEERRNFDIEAEQWDLNPERIKLANDVADAIIRIVKPAKNMDVLDFGCGTGLVTLRLQPYVRCIIGADSSKGMLSVVDDKVARQGFDNVYPQFVDFDKGVSLTGAFDLIVSSMTMHHVVPDTGMLFRMDINSSSRKVGYASPTSIRREVHSAAIIQACSTSGSTVKS
jgi:tRNA (cmo5U34)-methyltransferase